LLFLSTIPHHIICLPITIPGQQADFLVSILLHKRYNS